MRNIFRAKPILILLVVLTGLGGCQTPESSDFGLAMTNSTLILLNTTGRSCKQQLSGSTSDADDLPAVKAIVGGFSITWKGAKPLVLQYMRLRFSASGIQSTTGNSYDIVYSGTDLAYIFSGGTTAPIVPAAGATPVATPASTACSFEAGGIPVRDKTKSVYGSGSMLIYATTTDDSGQQLPVTAESFFSFGYTGVD